MAKSSVKSLKSKPLTSRWSETRPHLTGTGGGSFLSRWSGVARNARRRGKRNLAGFGVSAGVASNSPPSRPFWTGSLEICPYRDLGIVQPDFEFHAQLTEPQVFVNAR